MSFNWHSKHLTIETTNACNADCTICPRDMLKRKKELMSFGLFKKIVNDASQYKINHVGLSGFGEPLLDPFLFKRIAYLKKKIPSAKTHISSTCFLLDKKKQLNCLKYIDTLKISFYGMTKETYEKVHRGNLVFEKSMQNILDFLKLKGSNPKPCTIGLFVLTEENKHQKDEWINYWESRLDEVMVWKPHNWIDLKNYRAFNHSNQVSCGRPLNGPPTVLVNGKVTICCWDINNGLEIGDVTKQSFEEIFSGEKFAEIKRKHLAKDFKGTLCYNCAQTKPKDSDLIYSSTGKRKIGLMLAGTDLGVTK